MNSRLKFTIFSFLLVFIFISAFSFSTKVFAQTPGAIDGVDIQVDPVNPAPGENVNVTVSSYNTDLNAASIIWLVDGKSYAKGTGLTSVIIKAPQLGHSLNVIVAIMTVEKRQVQKSITIRSGDVDLIWESAGYTPPFFEGKATFSYQNSLKITAIPHLSNSASGAEIDPRTLLYKWTQNEKVLQDQSGYGRQSITLKDDLPQTDTISVEVTTPDGKQKAISSIGLQPGDPSISFYEEDSLYGVLYNKALVNNLHLSNQEIKIVAVPYSFSTYGTNSPLDYTWTINNVENPDLSGNQSVVLRTSGETDGSSAVSLDVKNNTDILQGASSAINIYFKKRVADTNNATF